MHGGLRGPAVPFSEQFVGMVTPKQVEAELEVPRRQLGSLVGRLLRSVDVGRGI